MRNKACLLAVMLLFVSFGCATMMDPCYRADLQRNVLKGGAVGAAAGAAIGALTGNSAGTGAAVGAVAGAAYGAMSARGCSNCPPPASYGPPLPPANSGRSSIYDQTYRDTWNDLAYQDQIREEQERYQERLRWQQQEHERARNDAYDDYYGRSKNGGAK